MTSATGPEPSEPEPIEAPDGPEREETPAERLDRNWDELLQELRVTQTGIQILSGFLLFLPFQSRFGELPSELVSVYLFAILFGTLSTAFMVAPVAAHRLLFRLHIKDRLVVLGDALAKAGILCLAVTVGLVVTLVIGLLVDVTAGWVAGVVALLAFAFLWLALPLGIRSRRRGTYPYR